MASSARRRSVVPVVVALAVAVLAVAGVLALGAGRPPSGTVDDDVAEGTDVEAADGAPVYVALGDSLTYGAGAEPHEGFVALLAEDLRAQLGRPVRVVNLAVPGARAADVTATQLPVLQRVLEDRRPVLVTLLVGTNDVWAGDPDGFRRELVTLLDALPDGALVADLPHLGLAARAAEERRLSEVVRDEVRRRPHLVHVALDAATAGVRPAEVSADGFHPSAAGYARFHAAFRAALNASQRR